MKIKDVPGSPGKRFKTHEVREDAADKHPPIFSFHFLRKSFCLTKCEKGEKADLAKTLHKLSQFTWADLRNAHPHGLGFEPIKRTDIKDAIPSHITEDVTIIAFRFSGKKAMVGYRDAVERKLFHIVWLDRSFKLYDHGA